jgi:hypothetical protein
MNKRILEIMEKGNWMKERGIPDIEDFKPAEEIERLQNINADLLEACQYAIKQLKNVKGKTFPIMPILNAIAKSERRG